MKTRSFLIAASSVLALMLGCHSTALDHPGPHITSETISADRLPAEFDPLRTYHYTGGRVDSPRALLVALWNSGLKSSRAWQPLDDQCFDPVGPRFTVEFQRDDPRIAESGFVRGDGRLLCASTLTAYTITPTGG